MTQLTSVHIPATIVLCCLMTTLTQAQDVGGPSQYLPSNAALCYWQAFAELHSLTPEEDNLLAQQESTDLTAGTRLLVDNASYALTALHRGASIERCEWGLDFDAGPYMLLPHLAKARRLAQFACLKMRHQIADGQVTDAIQTIRDTLILARHVASDAVIVSVLVQHSIEAMVYRAVCLELTKLDATAIDALAKALETLPKSSTFADALRQEPVAYANWARRITLSMGNAAETFDEFQRIGETNLRIADRDALTEAQLRQWIDQLEADYAQAREILALEDAAEFRRRWQTFRRQLRQQSPISAITMPALDRLRLAQDRRAVMDRLFRAGLMVQRNGEQALRQFKDPATGRSFEMRRAAYGWLIQSDFQYDGSPVQLQVGRR